MDEVSAILRLQRFAIRRLRLNDQFRVNRKSLIERLNLEKNLHHGIRMTLVYACVFSLLILGSMLTTPSGTLSVHDTYSRYLQLERSKDVSTLEDLKQFLKTVSMNTKKLQPSSGLFFNTEAEQKIVSGFRSFDAPVKLRLEGLHARVDSPAFSMTAWVKSAPKPGGYILRKPFADAGDASELSCWGWFFGASPRLDFGAHDLVSSVRRPITQESVKVPNWPWRTGWHLQTLVVTQDSAAFFQDDMLVTTVTLPRPMTDCVRETLEMGTDGMEVGDLTFYVGELSAANVQEIFSQGMTLHNIVTGSSFFKASATPVELLRAAAERQHTVSEESRLQQQHLTEEEHVLTRASVAIWNTDTSGLAAAGSLDPNCSDLFGDICEDTRLIKVTGLEFDPITQTPFYDLLPSTFLGGMMPGSRTTVDLRQRRHSYDPQSFPPLGDSWTLSWWSHAQETKVGAAFLLGAFSSKQVNLPCWSLSLRPEKITLYSTIEGQAESVVSIAIPPELDAEDFLLVGGVNLRHMAFAVDVALRRVKFFLDGNLVAEGSFRTDFSGSLSCPDNGTYFPFAHRPPEALDFVGLLQQLRLYPEVLNASHVHDLAFLSTDPYNREQLRQCKLPGEGIDSNLFVDLAGHGCDWYYEVRKSRPNVCANPSMRQHCPVACGFAKPCFSADLLTDKVPIYQVWDRIMWISPPSAETDHTVCLSSDADLTHIVKRCQDRQMAFAGGFRAAMLEAGNVLLNVSDCNALSASVSEYCAFQTKQNWTGTLDKEIAGGGDFTLTFWIRAAGVAAFASAYTPSLQLFSSLSPPEPVITFWAESGVDTRVSVMVHRPGGSSETVELKKKLSPNAWTQIAVIFSGRTSELTLVVNAEYSTIRMSLGEAWPLAKSGTFLQAMVTSSGSKNLFGPVELRSEALLIKTCQELYYRRLGAMRLRQGPAMTDAKRMKRTVKYDRLAFSAPGFLLAPPLLLQVRSQKTAECGKSYSSWGLQKVWHDIVRGPICDTPFECAADIRSSPLPLLSCSQDQFDETSEWFGKKTMKVGFGHLAGYHAFPEYLTSGTQVPMQVRNGETLDSDGLLDTETRMASVIMLLLAPDADLLSYLQITAYFEHSDVQIVREYSQVSGLEGAALQGCLVVHVTAFLVAVLLLVNNWYTIQLLRRRRRCCAMSSEVWLLIFDLLLNIGLVLHSVSRAVDLISMPHHLLSLVEEVMQTPWSDKTINLGTKTNMFFEGLTDFEGLLNAGIQERRYSLVLCWSTLLRVIQLTASHPRTAMLVNTFLRGLDDLWHFLLLFLLMFSAFGLLARALFGTLRREFYTLTSTFVVQFHMMLGSIPEGFGEDVDQTIYISLFVFTMYFFVVNFLLAIIVESYLEVKREVEKSEVEQGFFTDVKDMALLIFMRARYRFPDATAIERVLATQKGKLTIGIESIAIDGWSRAGRRAFLKYYLRYACLVPEVSAKRRFNKSSYSDLTKPISAKSVSNMATPTSGTPDELARIADAQEELQTSLQNVQLQLSRYFHQGTLQRHDTASQKIRASQFAEPGQPMG